MGGFEDGDSRYEIVSKHPIYVFSFYGKFGRTLKFEDDFVILWGDLKNAQIGKSDCFMLWDASKNTHISKSHFTFYGNC